MHIPKVLVLSSLRQGSQTQMPTEVEPLNLITDAGTHSFSGNSERIDPDGQGFSAPVKYL